MYTTIRPQLVIASQLVFPYTYFFSVYDVTLPFLSSKESLGRGKTMSVGSDLLV